MTRFLFLVLLAFVPAVLSAAGDCQIDDTTKNNGRQAGALILNTLQYQANTTNLDIQRQLFASVVTPDYFVRVNLGGIFGGISHGGLELAFEYLLLSNPIFNKGVYVPISAPNAVVTPLSANDIKTHISINIANSFGVTFLAEYDVINHFQDCGTLLTSTDININDDLAHFILGSIPPIQLLCQEVQHHCVGNNTQFKTDNECNLFYMSLPRFACASQFIGESFGCRYVHTILLPFSPDIHCPHTGPMSKPCSNKACSELSHVIAPSCTYNFRFNNGDCNQINKFEQLLHQGLTETDIQSLM
jgi:hypothetical protein